MKVNYNKSELAPLGRSRMEIYTHNFSPGMKITVDKIKILGITIPMNGKYEDLIKLNYDNKNADVKKNPISIFWEHKGIAVIWCIMMLIYSRLLSNGSEKR